MSDADTMLACANARIAELESQLRRREALEREQSHEVKDARNKIAKLEADVRIAQAFAQTSSRTAMTACERLESFTPVVEAARDVVEAYETDNMQAGKEAFARLIASVHLLPGRAS